VSLDTASSVVGGTLYNEKVSYADQLLVPDVASAAILPWEPATARLICDGHWPDGRPQAAAPRYVLQRLLDQAETRGYAVRAGFEYEFYLLDGTTGQPPFGGIHIVNSSRNTYVPVIGRILEQLPRAGVDLITANCEYGPAQFEINFSSNVGIRAADDAFTFKNGVKAISHQLGYNATFMTKPLSDQSASGCHVHVSLTSRETGRNLFLAGDSEDGLSHECRCFIQGLLDHAAAAMALMAPTVNCYHRFVPHHFAPSSVSWGIDDRTAMVRAKNPRDETTHLENRLPTALSNPYLALAATLAGELLGLGRGIPAAAPGAGPAESRAGWARCPAASRQRSPPWKRTRRSAASSARNSCASTRPSSASSLSAFASTSPTGSAPSTWRSIRR
jgi:glutamine synthetase